jgi:hypothetical protein
MKKFLVLGTALLIVFLAAGSVSAWTGYGHRYGHHPGHSRFGVFIGPPVIFVPPPPVRYYYYRSYPPDDAYDYYEQGDRVWVPGHLEYRETPYGWERVWVPGHWEWR